MTGERPITHFAVLRDGARWEQVKLTGLEVAADGALQLMRVPAPAEGEEIDLPSPYAVDPSGISVGRCGDLFIAHTPEHRVIWRDGVSGARMVLPSHGGAGQAPGHFDEPRGLLLGPAGLYVTETGNARVQLFRLPTLEPRASWSGPFQAPTGLAGDSLGRVYVLDRGLKRILRFSGWGVADDAFNRALPAALAGASPKFIAVDDENRLYVSDEVIATVRCFNEDGTAHDVLPLPVATPRFHAGALVAHGARLYAADIDEGRIWLYDLASRECAGALPGWRGPVTALAVDEHGGLCVKPGPSEEFHCLPADSGCVSSGQLVTERLDAGDFSGWYRAQLDAEQPPGTRVELQTFGTNAPSPTDKKHDDDHVKKAGPSKLSTFPPATEEKRSNDYAVAPGESDWKVAKALDLLLPTNVAAGLSEPQGYRFLWLRVRLSSDDGRVSPRLLQVQAETPGEDYMDHLPAVYRRKDNALDEPIGQRTGFLRRWLALFCTELGDLELLLEEMPRRFNAATVRAEDLPWLASWLALELPPGSLEQSRERLAGAMELYRRRGTPAGVREFIEIYTGVRPVIVESFRGRRIWQLGESSILGCDTALAPLSPHGMVVPDGAQLCNPAYDPDLSARCSSDRLVIGSAVVGASGPLDADDLGEPLFSETAHHFSVFVPAAKVREAARRDTLRRAIDAERPAHTDYDLCIVEPRMRVGLQSCIGIDSYIAGSSVPIALSGSMLGLNSYLGEEPGERGASRVGQRALLGSETILE